MGKQQISDFPFVISPVVVVATEYEGKLNFAPQGQYGTVTAEPPIIYISVVKTHRTAHNIAKTKQFSINIPDPDLFETVKHCGTVSGNDTDKSAQFPVFYGKSSVPMVQACKVNFVCEVIQSVDLYDCYMFLGQIREIYADDTCLTNGVPDVLKIKPIVCSIDGKFWMTDKELF
jgi:flavin reductase (DIM6/NTAB) family NADH-FMN oxidoreductase RutF